MNRLKFLIVGAGGRESAFAKRLCKDTELYAVISHRNPTIVDCVNKTKGAYCIGDSSDPQTVLRFAQQHDIDYVFVSADDPLANGVVDVLLEHNIKAIGGTKAASRIEWDKVYSIEIMQRVGAEYTPFYRIVFDIDKIVPALDDFIKNGLAVVVKPQGLTGGKGVKVMPEHLDDYEACAEYAKELLTQRPDEAVLFVEKLEGIEFTIMGITDGETLVLSPASYDYPFRNEGDSGPGTGGMGCFTSSEKKLPFMTDKDLDDCRIIMQRIIDEMKRQSLFFNGVLNGGFFKTRKGIQFMEFNSRFGDPEGLNILSVLETPFSQLLIHLWNKTLSEAIFSFIPKASVIKYLVAKEYPSPSEDATEFTVDEAAILNEGVAIFFASCEQTSDHTYTTLKKSRVVAFGALADNIPDASARINGVIEKYVTGGLEYRADIGSRESLQKLDKKKVH